MVSAHILWVQLEYNSQKVKTSTTQDIRNFPQTLSEVRNQALLILNASHNVQTSPSGRWPAAPAVLLGTVQKKTIYLAVAEDWVYSNTAGQWATVQ